MKKAITILSVRISMIIAFVFNIKFLIGLSNQLITKAISNFTSLIFSKWMFR